jgi:hypothetical protein
MVPSFRYKTRLQFVLNVAVTHSIGCPSAYSWGNSDGLVATETSNTRPTSSEYPTAESIREQLNPHMRVREADRRVQGRELAVR